MPIGRAGWSSKNQDLSSQFYGMDSGRLFRVLVVHGCQMMFLVEKAKTAVKATCELEERNSSR